MNKQQLCRLFAIISLIAMISILTSPIIWIYYDFITFIKFTSSAIIVCWVTYFLMKQTEKQ